MSNLKKWLNFRFFSFISVDCSIDVCGNVSEVLDDNTFPPAKPAWRETMRTRAYPVAPRYQDLRVFLYAMRLWSDSYRPIRLGDWVYPDSWGCSSRGEFGEAMIRMGQPHACRALTYFSSLWSFFKAFSKSWQKWDPIQIQRALKIKRLKNTPGIPGSQISLLLLLVGFIGNLLFGIVNLHLWQNWDFEASMNLKVPNSPNKNMWILKNLQTCLSTTPAHAN